MRYVCLSGWMCRESHRGLSVLTAGLWFTLCWVKDPHTTEQNSARGWRRLQCTDCVCICVCVCVRTCLSHEDICMCHICYVKVPFDGIVFPMVLKPFRWDDAWAQWHITHSHTCTRTLKFPLWTSKAMCSLILFWWAHTISLPGVMSSCDLPEHSPAFRSSL